MGDRTCHSCVYIISQRTIWRCFLQLFACSSSSVQPWPYPERFSSSRHLFTVILLLLWQFHCTCIQCVLESKEQNVFWMGVFIVESPRSIYNTHSSHSLSISMSAQVSWWWWKKRLFSCENSFVAVIMTFRVVKKKRNQMIHHIWLIEKERFLIISGTNNRCTWGSRRIVLDRWLWLKHLEQWHCQIS